MLNTRTISRLQLCKFAKHMENVLIVAARKLMAQNVSDNTIAGLTYGIRWDISSDILIFTYIYNSMFTSYNRGTFSF